MVRDDPGDGSGGIVGVIAEFYGYVRHFVGHTFFVRIVAVTGRVARVESHWMWGYLKKKKTFTKNGPKNHTLGDL